VLDNYYLETNPELHELHYFAGIAYRETGEYEKSISHLNDSLRYKKIEYKQDDRVFYELSKTYKELGSLTAYHNSLEFAFNMNPQNSTYSKELGISFYNTRKKEKAIYYLEEYISLVDDGEIDSDIYLKLAGLNIDKQKFLRTQDYYQQYLKKNDNDGQIYFALGDIAYQKTGNFKLALNSYSKALDFLDEDDLITRSRCHEYSADIFLKQLKYDNAITAYMNAIEIEELFVQKIDDKKVEIENLELKLDELKRELLKQNNYVKYNEYQFQSQELERMKYEKLQLDYQYTKFNPGERRWNLAVSFEQTNQLDNAVRYYQESIRFNYNPNKSRDRIKKIQLKIKRGY
jgi:tetratricopeptide (TPR) repeat protein